MRLPSLYHSTVNDSGGAAGVGFGGHALHEVGVQGIRLVLQARHTDRDAILYQLLDTLPTHFWIGVYDCHHDLQSDQCLLAPGNGSRGQTTRPQAYHAVGNILAACHRHRVVRGFNQRNGFACNSTQSAPINQIPALRAQFGGERRKRSTRAQRLPQQEPSCRGGCGRSGCMAQASHTPLRHVLAGRQRAGQRPRRVARLPWGGSPRQQSGPLVR
jgi:hypothetical protein